MMRSLVFAVPAAGEIQSGNNHQPHDVNTKQVKAVAFRSKCKPIAYSGIFPGIAHDKKDDDIDNADEIKVKYKIKEWHPAVNNKYPRKLILNLFE